MAPNSLASHEPARFCQLWTVAVGALPLCEQLLVSLVRDIVSASRARRTRKSNERAGPAPSEFQLALIRIDRFFEVARA